MFGKEHGFYQLLTQKVQHLVLGIAIKMPTCNQTEEREDILPKKDEKGKVFVCLLVS